MTAFPPEAISLYDQIHLSIVYRSTCLSIYRSICLYHTHHVKKEKKSFSCSCKMDNSVSPKKNKIKKWKNNFENAKKNYLQFHFH